MRTPAHPIEPLFLDRWSPRAFTGEALPEAELHRMLEAARWAPSANNAQPWRFLYALRGDAHWDTFRALPNDRNRRWSDGASALVLVLSHEAGRTHAFDAGCAWGYLALQASAMGWATHAIAGFDAAQARERLQVPADHALQAMVAVGRRGDAAGLPEDLREREAPSQRRPLEAVARAGVFSFPGA